MTHDPGGADIRLDPKNLSAAEKARRRVRFPTLDAESQMLFAEGFKKWAGGVASRSSAEVRTATDQEAVTLEQAWNMMTRNPAYAAQVRLQWSIHDFMWDRAGRAFGKDPEQFLAAMEETDNIGPGSLELNPGMTIPDYPRHEVHRQPGGYVGDPFGGWVYHYALTLAHYQRRATHGELQIELANAVPKPADGSVRRVLDIGCSSGVLTTALKERFPQAEIWGVDVAAPMVRYAHHRAVKLGLDVHFAQRLAEDSRFPNDCFDVATDYLLFHEVSPEAAHGIVTEMARIIRPGGIWCHNDAQTAGWPEDIYRPDESVPGKAMAWNIYRHNYEPWYETYKALDFPALLREAGFDVDMSGPPLFRGRPSLNAVKRR